MFGFSGEHLLILAGILLIFGPRKLPELGASIGRALRNFKEGLNGPHSSGTLEVKQQPTAALDAVAATDTRSEASKTPPPPSTTTPPPSV